MSSFMGGRYTLDSISLADLSPSQTRWLGHGRGRSPMALPQRKAAGIHDPWRRYPRYSPECVEGVFSEVWLQDPAYWAARVPEVGRDHLRLLITVTCALLRAWIDLRFLGWSGVGLVVALRSLAHQPGHFADSDHGRCPTSLPHSPKRCTWRCRHTVVSVLYYGHGIKDALQGSQGRQPGDAVLPDRPLRDDGRAGIAAVGFQGARASGGARVARGRALCVARRCREGAAGRAREDGRADRGKDTQARR